MDVILTEYSTFLPFKVNLLALIHKSFQLLKLKTLM